MSRVDAATVRPLRRVEDSNTTNRDMLALNEHLGYRRLLVVEDWLRGEATPAG